MRFHFRTLVSIIGKNHIFFSYLFQGNFLHLKSIKVFSNEYLYYIIKVGQQLLILTYSILNKIKILYLVGIGHNVVGCSNPMG